MVMAAEPSLRDRTILMLWTTEARLETAPQPPSQLKLISTFYLVQLSLRGLPQIGVHCPPKGLDQRLGIHHENSVYGSDFNISEVYQFPVTAHMDAQLSGYPARKEAVNEVPG